VLRTLHSRILTLTVAAIGAWLSLASAAEAQGPEFVPVSQGSSPSISSTWQALAVTPNQIFFDLYNDEGALYQTYATEFQAPSKRTVTAVGQRPLGLPTVAASVSGVAGKRVRKVRIHFRGGMVVRRKTVGAPREWGFAGRFFAAGVSVGDAYANTTQVATRIDAVDRDGRVLSKQRSIFTDPF
jgi:hypothetical protein